MKNKVILVGSNEEMQQALKFLFEMNGYLPEMASGPAEVSVLLESGTIDCVILDLNVGKEAGEKILAYLESMENPPEEVVIALTEQLGAQELARIRALARRVVFKPFSFEELLAEIQQHCIRKASGANF